MLMLGEGTPYVTHAWPRFGPADSDYLDFKGLTGSAEKEMGGCLSLVLPAARAQACR